MIEPGTKAPTYPAWQRYPIGEDVAGEIAVGAGLLHALSGTCALDLDNLTLAKIWLEERGVDLDSLLAAEDRCQISSGRPNRAKLLYKLSKPLRTFKPPHSGLELRCATQDGLSVQDVLPPSVHPDTKLPYEWVTGLLGDWREIPPIPPTLLALWRELAESVQVLPADGIASKPQGETIESLRKLIAKRSPDEYEEWLQVGMILHHETGGSIPGLKLWDEWSQTTTREKDGKSVYPGREALIAKWKSFRNDDSSNAVTVGTLKKDSVAEADDFTEVTPDDEAEAAKAQEAEKKVEEAVGESKKKRKEGAEELLTKRLVYVHNAEKYFDVKHHHLIGSDNALDHQFRSLMPKVGKGRLDPVKVLKDTSKKRYVKAMGFHPGEGPIFAHAGHDYANNYRNELPDPIEPMADELDKIEWLFARLENDVFCDWLKKFYGHVVQYPGVKINSAPLLWSETTGNGKNTLMKDIPALLVGGHYSSDISCDVLTSTFSDFLYGAWHIYLSEFRAGTRGERQSIATKLKNWIADPTVSVHPKGKAAYTMPNHFFMTGSSNEDDAAAIDSNDRRWGIHEFPAPRMTPAEAKWIHDEFLKLPRATAVLRHYFLNVDLAGFQPKAPAPHTAAREAMIENSTTMDVTGMQGLWERMEAPFDKDILLTHEGHEIVQQKPWGRFMSQQKFAKMVTRFGGVSQVYKTGGKTFRAMILRNRETWALATGKSVFEYLNGNDEFSVDHDPLFD